MLHDRLLHYKLRELLHMNKRFIAHYLVLLILTCGLITTLSADNRSKAIEKHIELDGVKGISHWLPIEFSVKNGDQSLLTVTGSQRVHDALLVTNTRNRIAVDLDLAVLCPDSKQKFARDKSFPAKLHRSKSLRRYRGDHWAIEFGKDCVVDSRDLGSPVIELTTSTLARIDVTNFGKLYAQEMEMNDNQIRLNVGGLAWVEVNNIQGKHVQVSASGQSDLVINSIDAVSSKIAVNGLAELALDSLVSTGVEFKLSGSSEAQTTSISTDRLNLSMNGLSDFQADTVQTNSKQVESMNTAISSLDLSGSCDVSIKHLQLPRLEVDASGLSDLTLGQVSTNQLILSGSGSSGMSFEELTAKESEIETSGLSDLKIVSLESKMVEIHASGSSDVEVRKAKVEQFDVQATGISDVTLRGREWSGIWDG